MKFDPAIFKQRAPCADCPFRREGGVRHSLRMMASYISYFIGPVPATFPCHKSVPKSDPRNKWSAWQDGQVICAGGLIFALKQQHCNKLMTAGLMSGAYDPAQHLEVDAVFNTPAEMLASAEGDDADKG